MGLMDKRTAAIKQIRTGKPVTKPMKICLSYHWQDFTTGSTVPAEAISTGNAEDGSPIYFGRVKYERELLSVTYFSGTKKAFISYYDTVKEVFEFKLLMNYLPEYTPIWSKTGYGNLPNNPIEVGYDNEHVPCYVARVLHSGIWVPGKYYPSRNTCYFVDDQKEGSTAECEVLVNRIDGYDWIGTTKNNIPKDYFVVGQDESGNDIGVGYTYYKDERTLVKILPAKGTASITYATEIFLDDTTVIHVLVQHVKRRSLQWVHVKEGEDYSNKDVVRLGYTHNGRMLHLGRYLRNGVYVPGKVYKYDHFINFSINGAEEYSYDFEVLTLPTLKEN